MQAVILAAGRGTRMQPVSSIAPKPMLPVAGQPLAAHVADRAVAAGADELLFVVAAGHPHVQSYFGERYADTPVTYAVQSPPAGTADAVRTVADQLEGRFAVLNGDTIIDEESVARLFEHEAAVAGHSVPNPEEYGVLSTTNGVLTGVVEKPSKPVSNLVNAGAIVFPEAASALFEVPESERGEHELTDSLERLCHDREVAVVETERWIDVARPADLHRAGGMVLEAGPSMCEGLVDPTVSQEGTVVIGQGASVAEGVTIEGPVYIGRGAVVERNATLIGPVALGAGSAVGHTGHLERVTVFPDTVVPAQVRLNDVVLGPNCELSTGAHLAGLTDEVGCGTAAFVSTMPTLQDSLTY